jgi:uncharacterized protein (TIGR02996 family)
MTAEAAFVAQLLERPDDDVTRLVYADWLEESGDERSSAVRQHPELFRFLASLRSAADEKKALGPLGEWVFGGRIDLVRALRLFLGCHPSPSRTIPILPGISASLMAALFSALTPLPTPQLAEPQILWLRRYPIVLGNTRQVASRLAYEQPPGVLLAILDGFKGESGYRELLACLAQEMVVRGVVLAGIPAAEELAAELREIGHPLSHLPLHLTAAEGYLRPLLPAYAFGGEGRAMPFAPPAAAAPRPLPPGPRIDGITDTNASTDALAFSSLRAAIHDWLEHSNGRAEERFFVTRIPIREDALSAGTLLSLRLDCLAGANEGELQAEQIGPTDAFAVMFSAASQGGAYGAPEGDGMFGAYGRAAAMRSLGALAGTPEDDIEAISTAACRCLWVRLGTATDWFYHVAWDYGLLAVRPDRMSVAVLAVTDTD